VNKGLLIKIDMHVHTVYSYDGLITPNQLVWQLKRKNLNGVAITDHDTMLGISIFRRKLEKHGFLVIPGIEVTAKKAHIIGLNISEKIPAGLEIEETVELIHDAGGLAVAAHPTVVYRGWSTHHFGKFDCIEVINASSFPFFFSVYFSRKIAQNFGLPEVAGSDAHYFMEVGFAYAIICVDDLNVEGVLEAIKRKAVTAYGKPTPLHIRLKKEALTLKKRFS